MLIMENVLTLQNNFITLWIWKDVSKSNTLSKTIFTKPSSHLCPLAAHNSTRHKTLLVESYHEHQKLRALLAQLNNKASCPLHMLQNKDHFWAVIRFLRLSSRSSEILQVFNLWKGIENSRINECDYEKIIVLLSEEGLMEDASSALIEMKRFGLRPSLQIYNSIIHGYSGNGKFNDALFYLNQIKQVKLTPESYTYDGLIQGYGKYKMYDEVGMSLKKMEMDGCSPDQATYNLVIQQFALAGLLTRMESSYQSMRSKKMILQSSTLIAMLEAYVNYGIVIKMEKAFKRVLNSNAHLKEDLVRKIAVVYIENLMFSRLNDLGIYLSSSRLKTDIVWCLRLLSSACSLSVKGMDYVVKEMEEAKVSWNATFVNIMLLAYLKMKDLARLRILLGEITNCLVKPDIVTVGILLDANEIGFYRTGTLETWRKMGILYRCVEMNTDALVLTAFGKGRFLAKCEEAYSSLDRNAREKKWTYSNIMDLVAKNNGKQADEES
ncbi:pentatricopeptide repeat-containing protein At4g14190, chloroplastic [Euphorbia lathyris]|uniref:pentatricopeptide repeat-containing protein At4g14190, chloroplastic n=1 Tax=Euphorbia lathyris TaxID=212925 RepID=UPI00331378FF